MLTPLMIFYTCNMSPQQLIMQKAAEDLKKKQAEEEAIKRIAIDERVPKLVLDGLNQGSP